MFQFLMNCIHKIQPRELTTPEKYELNVITLVMYDNEISFYLYNN